MDQKTIFVILILILLISDLALFILWRENRNRFGGLNLWLANFMLQTAGFTLIVLQGMIPDFISIVVASNLIFLGWILLISGMEKYLGLRVHKIPNFILLGISVALYSFFTIAQPNIYVRDFVFNGMMIILYSQLAWLFLRRVSPELLNIGRLTAAICVLFIVNGIVRAVLQLPLQMKEYFESGIVEVITVTVLLILTISMTISMVLSVSKRLRREVQMETYKSHKLFNSVPYAMILSRLADQTIIDINGRMEKLSGYSSNEIIGKPAYDLNIWISIADHHLILDQLILGKEVNASELELRRKDNAVITVMYSASVINLYGEACILSCLNDVSEMSQIKKRLSKMATHDQLTGLPNRVLLYDRYEMTMAHAARCNKKMAVAMIDLDCFKDINDAFGHAVGDKLLVHVGRRILRFSRKEDTAARFGGDEFIILMSDIQNRAIADSTLKRLLHAFTVPFMINGEALMVTLSIGVALYPDDGSEINDLVRKADISMYHVKKNGKNNLRFFEEDMKVSLALPNPGTPYQSLTG